MQSNLHTVLNPILLINLGVFISLISFFGVNFYVIQISCHFFSMVKDQKHSLLL